MKGHIAPHRLADLAAGRIGGRPAARVRVHLDGCVACRATWERVRGARAAFGEIGTAAAPELRWDRVRAQVYWSLGTGSYPVVVAPPSRWPWLAVPALAAAAAAVLLWSPWSSPASAPVPVPVRSAGPALVSPPAPPLPPPIAVDLAPASIAGVVTLIEGDASLQRTPGAAESVDPDAIGGSAVTAGARLATGDGRVALQLGAGSVITLGARSALSLVRFDEGGVELVVDGQVDIEVSKRSRNQRFAVLAGGRVILVRGTAFRVTHHDGDVAVACEHGRVAVSSGGATVEIGAGQGLALDDAEPLLGRAPHPLGDAELASLVASRAAALPAWTDPATVLRTTAPLAVVAPRARAVRVDGVVIGTGPVWMRVAPGRHLVDAERAPGRFSPARWVEVDGAASRPLVLADATPGGSPTGPAAGRRARKTELEQALDQSRLRSCVRALEKQGIAAGTHVELEVGVDGAGAIRFLNITNTDLPARAAGCVRDAVAASRLGAGAAASWRHRIRF